MLTWKLNNSNQTLITWYADPRLVWLSAIQQNERGMWNEIWWNKDARVRTANPKRTVNMQEQDECESTSYLFTSHSNARWVFLSVVFYACFPFWNCKLICMYDNLEIGFIYMFYVPEILSLLCAWRLFIYISLFAFIEMEKHGKSSCLHAPRTNEREAFCFLEMGVVQLGILLDGHVAIYNIFDDESYFTMCYAYFPLARRKVPESAEPITPMVGGAEPTALALREPVGTRQIQVRANSHVCDNPRWQLQSMASTYLTCNGSEVSRNPPLWRNAARLWRRWDFAVQNVPPKVDFCNDLFLLADCMPGHHIVSLPFIVVVTGLILTTYINILQQSNGQKIDLFSCVLFLFHFSFCCHWCSCFSKWSQVKSACFSNVFLCLVHVHSFKHVLVRL